MCLEELDGYTKERKPHFVSLAAQLKDTLRPYYEVLIDKDSDYEHKKAASDLIESTITRELMLEGRQAFISGNRASKKE